MSVKISEICDGIATTLSVATGVKSWTLYNEVSEGIPNLDCPRLEVHPDSGTTDPTGGTDRSTFGAGVQLMAASILVDLYVCQRSQMQDDMKDAVDLIDAISDVLETEERPPFFGEAGIKAYSWNFRRVTFVRSGALYMGARFTINCRIF